jgi:hypothetical protein
MEKEKTCRWKERETELRTKTTDVWRKGNKNGVIDENTKRKIKTEFWTRARWDGKKRNEAK